MMRVALSSILGGGLIFVHGNISFLRPEVVIGCHSLLLVFSG